MKGMRNMIDRWHYDRDSGGWKVKGKYLQAMLVKQFQISELSREDNARGAESNTGKDMIADLAWIDFEEPPTVLPVERLLSDVRALKKLAAPAMPPQVKLRAHEVLHAIYLPGNASGAGFGSTVIGIEGIMYESRTWNADWSKESSNFREVDKPVNKLKSLVREGKIQG